MAHLWIDAIARLPECSWSQGRDEDRKQPDERRYHIMGKPDMEARNRSRDLISPNVPRRD